MDLHQLVHISDAFNTISHTILLQRFEMEFSVMGTELNWLQSFLKDLRQYVKLGWHCSDTVSCSSGVPQGSVLGPLLSAAYVSPVGDLIKSGFGFLINPILFLNRFTTFLWVKHSDHPELPTEDITSWFHSHSPVKEMWWFICSTGLQTCQSVVHGKYFPGNFKLVKSLCSIF